MKFSPGLCSPAVVWRLKIMQMNDLPKGMPMMNNQAVSAPLVEPPEGYELALKVIPMPGDCNANGDIFGGWVMANLDLAGSVLPARYTQGRMATVAVNEFIFKQPVRVGDILSFYAKVVHIGNTSIRVHVEALTERFDKQGQYIKVTEATITYVAIDEQGRPRSVPKR